MVDEDEGRLHFLRRATDRPRRRFRRGVYVLPSLFTLGNMFCGYACVVYAMRGEYETAAPFIGFSIVLDMLDGRIARLTGTHRGKHTPVNREAGSHTRMVPELKYKLVPGHVPEAKT